MANASSKEEMATEIGDLAALAAATIMERLRERHLGKPKSRWTEYGSMMLRCLVECRLDNEFDMDFEATVRDQAPELIRSLYPGIPDCAIQELLTEVIVIVNDIAKRYVN